MINKAIKIHPNDNLIVAINDLKKGENVTIDNQTITMQEPVKQKHKFAQIDIEKGEPLLMYGVKVGKANQKVLKGSPLTSENMDNAFNENVNYENVGKLNFKKSKNSDRFFMGYQRKDGSVGTQNIWLFFPLVFCENRNIELLKTVFEREFYPDKLHKHQQFLRSLVQNTEETITEIKHENPFSNVDVRFITHHSGCGGTK